MIAPVLSIARRLRGAAARWRLERHRQAILAHADGGAGLHLDGPLHVAFGDRLVLGEHVHIGHDCALNCRGGIEIGDHTIISGRVTIYSYDHGFRHPDRLPYDETIRERPVRIGRYVWVGMNVSIAPGTVIGDGAVIGIGAVVSGEIPANAIVVSPRHRIVGSRDEAHTADLVARGCFHDHAGRRAA